MWATVRGLGLSALHWIAAPAEATMERLLLAGLLTAGILLGLGGAWDVYWHATIGRDSLFIPPHVIVYSGVLLAGGTAALALIKGWMNEGAGGLRVAAGRWMRDGSGVAGIGFAAMVWAAVLDAAWHRVVGDVTIWSPPHVLAVLGGLGVALGLIVAFERAPRRHLLTHTQARRFSLLVWGGCVAATYFGALPAAMMALRGGSSFWFITDPSPYLVSVVSVLTVPPLVRVTTELLGRTGFVRVAAVGAGLWGLQELFSLIATPPVARGLGYLLRQEGSGGVLLHLVILGSLLIPAVIASQSRFRSPMIGGALLGGMYVAEAVAWRWWLGLRMGEADPFIITGIVFLSAATWTAGGWAARWVGRLTT